MDDQLADILDQCLQRIGHGATIDDCLAAHPTARAELEPPLRMAAQLGELPRPALPATTRVALETQMLQLAAQRRAGQTPIDAPLNGAAHPVPSWRRIDPSAVLAAILRSLGYQVAPRQPWLRLAAVALAIVFALVLGVGAVAAARAVISVIRPQPTAAPTSAPTSVPLALDGIIEQVSQERWVVGGRTIVLDSRTTIQGAPAPGLTAHVRGSMAVDGALLAESIAVDAPTALPTNTPAPTTIPTATQAPTVLPTATLAPTAIPTAVPTVPPAPAAPPAPKPQPAAPPAAPSNGGGNGHTCQGQQRGRDDKKCDPKPKPPGGKHDDKGKGKGPHK